MAEEPTREVEDAPSASDRCGATRLLPFAVGAVATVFAVAIARAVVSDWTPFGDRAFEILRTDDVGGPHTPLVGAYSRTGGFHPGPLQFWLTAPGLHLGGPAGAMAITGLIALAWFLLSVAAARRLAGDPFALAVTAAVAVLVAAGGPKVLTDLWNPWVGTFPTLCTILALVAFADTGTRWCLLAGLASGSYAVQAHLGMAPIVGATLVGAGVWWFRARPPVKHPARLAGAAAALLALLWSGPLLQQVRGPDGNLAQILSFAVNGSGEPRPPLRTALGVAARELGPWAPWFGSGEGGGGTVPTAPIWFLALPLVLLAVAILVSSRRGDRRRLRLAVLALTLQAVSVLAILRVDGVLYGYVLRWTWPVASFTVVAGAWSLWPVVASHADRRWGSGRSATFATVAIGVLVVVAAVPTARVAWQENPAPYPGHSTAGARLAASIRSQIPLGRYNADWAFTAGFGAAPTAAFVDLDLHGFDVIYPDYMANAVGRHRVGADRSAPTVWIGALGTPPPREATPLAEVPPSTDTGGYGYAAFLVPPAAAD